MLLASNRISNGLLSPHSPDLNTLDFFFWGAAKAEIYKNSPRTLADLKEAVSTFTRDVSVGLCKIVVENFCESMHALIAKDVTSNMSITTHVRKSRFLLLLL